MKYRIFKYLGCEISYGNDRGCSAELSTFAEILGTLYNTFKPTWSPEIFKNERYNAPNLPILLYGSEVWTFRKRDKKRLASV